MIRIVVIGILSLVLLSGCNAQQVAKENPAASYPFRHSNFDYRVAWKEVATDKGMLVDGILKNVRYPFIESLDLTLFLIDKNNKIRARGTTIPIPQHSRENDVIPFSIELSNVSPAQGDILQFLIHYKATEGGDNDGLEWRSSFKVDALTGAGLDNKSTEPEKW